VYEAYEGIVVRDASFGSDPELPTGSSLGADGRAPQLPANDLTNELARLLAAAIARQQAGNGSAAMTNAGLTSLANLVTATSSQRTLAPVFRDGLSALSYSPPRPHTNEPEPAELHPDDEPMPIPSTWRQPTYGDEDRWYRQPMGAALLGLTAGLMIVVPVVLWMSGWLDARRGRTTVAAAPVAAVAASASAPDLKAAEVRTLKVQVRPLDATAADGASAPLVTASVEPRSVSEAPAVVEQPSPAAIAARFAETQAAELRARQERLLVRALQRVESGDVPGAREMLAAADDGSQGSVAFALAETYDPNMLAAWGARGVAADVAKAKALYRKALSLGVANAQGRLDALR
jgi:hypothetical protein